MNPTITRFSNDSFYANATNGFTGFNNGDNENGLSCESDNQVEEELVTNLKSNTDSNQDK